MCIDEVLVRQAFEHLEIMKLISKKKKNPNLYKDRLFRSLNVAMVDVYLQLTM